MNSCIWLVLVSILSFCSSDQECSRFHYEEKTLEKIVKTDFLVGRLKSKLKESEATTKAELEKIREDLKEIKSDVMTVKERYEDSSEEYNEILEHLKGL